MHSKKEKKEERAKRYYLLSSDPLTVIVTPGTVSNVRVGRGAENARSRLDDVLGEAQQTSRLLGFAGSYSQRAAGRILADFMEDRPFVYERQSVTLPHGVGI